MMRSFTTLRDFVRVISEMIQISASPPVIIRIPSELLVMDFRVTTKNQSNLFLNIPLKLQVMCMQYWPPALDKKEVYGDIYIGIDKEEQLANFHIRTFRIWKQNEDVCFSYLTSLTQIKY